MSFFQDEHPKIHNNYRKDFHFDFLHYQLFTRETYKKLKKLGSASDRMSLEKLKDRNITPMHSLFCVYICLHYVNMEISLLCLICREKMIPLTRGEFGSNECMREHVRKQHSPYKIILKTYPRDDLVFESPQSDIIYRYLCDISFTQSVLHEAYEKEPPFFGVFHTHECFFCREEYSVPPATEVVVAHLKKCAFIAEITRKATDNAKIE